MSEQEAKREPAFWGAPECERLDYDSEDDAIEAILDDGDPCPLFPEPITIAGYARMVADATSLASLEHCFEALDEEYGDPDDSYPRATEAMLEAEKAFLAVILREYVPWACEEVCRKEIDVVAWIKAHRPDWLKEVTDGHKEDDGPTV